MSVRGDREVLTEATVHHGGLGLYRVNVSVGPTHTVVYRHGPLCNAQTDLIMKHKISLFKRNPFKTLMSQVGQVIVIDKVVKRKEKNKTFIFRSFIQTPAAADQRALLDARLVQHGGVTGGHAAVVLPGAMLALTGRGAEQRLGAGDRVLLRPPALQPSGRGRSEQSD